MGNKRIPKFMWGKRNPDWRPEAYRATNYVKVDGHVQSAKDDFNFKRTGMVLHDPSGDFYHYSEDGEDLEEVVIDIDGDGKDDTAEITSHEVVSGDFPDIDMTRKFCYESSAWMVANCGIPEVLMATIHDDFLYGMAHKTTVPSYYIVSNQNINMDISMGNNKITVVGLDQYSQRVYDLNTRAIEARYSPYCVFSSNKAREKIYNLTLSDSDIAKSLDTYLESLSTSTEGVTNADIDRLTYANEIAMAGKYTPVWKEPE